MDRGQSDGVILGKITGGETGGVSGEADAHLPEPNFDVHAHRKEFSLQDAMHVSLVGESVSRQITDRPELDFIIGPTRAHQCINMHAPIPSGVRIRVGSCD